SSPPGPATMIAAQEQPRIRNDVVGAGTDNLGGKPISGHARCGTHCTVNIEQGHDIATEQRSAARRPMARCCGSSLPSSEAPPQTAKNCVGVAPLRCGSVSFAPLRGAAGKLRLEPPRTASVWLVLHRHVQLAAALELERLLFHARRQRVGLVDPLLIGVVPDLL